jgi:2-polyprenyl-6-methoxyphenol hydroxylase-like FAD-dependent oxidoreductase
MQVTEFDVLIVGGGLAGLALASALRDTRFRIALVERRPPRPAPDWDARIYAVSPANADFLQAIGAWKHMAPERMAPISFHESLWRRRCTARFLGLRSGCGGAWLDS